VQGDALAGETEFGFTVDVFKPETFPMERLAQYMQEFARLLGSTEHIHFKMIKDGSTTLVSSADPVCEPKVDRRLLGLRTNAGTKDARESYRRIDEMLAEDDAVGTVHRNNSKVLDFPGRTRPKVEEIDMVRQHECIDGELQLIGGRDETVPVHLYDAHLDRHFKCNTSKQKARELAPFLFGPELRIFGESEWKRDSEGIWSMKTLWIDSFLVLNQDPVPETIRRLRSIPGNTWHEVADPAAELLDIRYGSEASA
jgi:hypothetical protein